MRDFSFLHMADLHLGSPFKGVSVDDPQTARRFAQAIRDTFSALVSRALADDVDFVVIAGDIYDREWKDAAIGLFFNRELARLHRADIPVYLVKGNHDAASVVTRSVTLPEGVRTFDHARASTLTLPHLGVALHGQSYRDREAAENLALGYPDPVPGHFNIGVLHTSMSGHEGHAPYAPCSEDDLVARGYDYWALGHIHVPQVVRERPAIVYPGCIQGRSVRELGPHGAVLVRVNDGVAKLEPIVADRVRWCVATVDCGDVADFVAEAPARVEEAVRVSVAEADERLVALRVVLEGETPTHGWAHANRDEMEAEVSAAAARVSADIWIEKIDLRTASVDAQAGGPSLVPELAEGFDLATLLSTVAADPALRDALEADRRALSSKLPGDGAAPKDVAALLEEARALLGERLSPGRARDAGER